MNDNPRSPTAKKIDAIAALLESIRVSHIATNDIVSEHATMLGVLAAAVADLRIRIARLEDANRAPLSRH